jgi:hypothetical protein
MKGIASRILAVAALVATTFALAACSGSGHTRGMFTGKVMGKTEAEIVEEYGQPASVDRKSPDSPVLVYTNKTFDPDNSNRPDPETLIFLAKDAKSGKVVAADIAFRG